MSTVKITMTKKKPVQLGFEEWLMKQDFEQVLIDREKNLNTGELIRIGIFHM